MIVVEISYEEERELLRDSIVTLLSRDPHCPIANLLGQRLMDLEAEQINY